MSMSGSPSRGAPPHPVREALFQPFDESDEDDILPVTAGPSRPSSGAPSRPPASTSQSKLNLKAEKRKPVSSSQAEKTLSQSSVRPDFVRGYLGEFVCEGWSLSKGKGYCSPGSKIVFERPKPKTAHPPPTAGSSKAGPAKLVNGKIVNAKKPIGGTQMKLSAMIGKKPPPPVSLPDTFCSSRQPPKKPAKAKVDQIIRFRNERGFGG
jgi:DNA repair protein RAD5